MTREGAEGPRGRQGDPADGSRDAVDASPDPAADDLPSLVGDEAPPSPGLELEHERTRPTTALLGLLALGVVYGDIGTSPIYAFRESLHGRGTLAANPVNVLGILHVTYYIGRERPVPVGRLGMNRWRARVFEFLSRVSPRPEERFLLPRDEVVEIGIQIGV